MPEVGEGNDEYSHAKKLVLRAAKREAILSSSGLVPDGNFSSSMIGADFSSLHLKPDHIQRPCWTCPDGNIYLEAFHDLYLQAYDFLVAISEPVARPEFLHQYKLTPYSLYAAVATNIETESIIGVLDRLSKNSLPSQVKKFIRDCTSKYGKAKLVLKHNKFYVESEFPEVLRELLRDPTIAQARIQEDINELTDDHGFITQTKAEEMKENLHLFKEPDDDSDDEGPSSGEQKKPAVVVSFQVDGTKVENVKRQAIDLDYPLMEEYDFRNDVSSFFHKSVNDKLCSNRYDKNLEYQSQHPIV
jgi:DNA excision repair protein ERCC-3